MRKMGCFLLCLILCGCSQSPPLPPPVVTEITVTELTATPPGVQTFLTDQQTSQVLNYLRLLDIQGPAQVNPEYVAGEMYAFQITYSDGSRKTIMQKSDRYFKGLDGLWQQIEPYSGSRLPRLLQRKNTAPS